MAAHEGSKTVITRGSGVDIKLASLPEKVRKAKFITACTPGSQAVSYGEELHAATSALGPSNVVHLVETRKHEIIKALFDNPVGILHFSCHGTVGYNSECVVQLHDGAIDEDSLISLMTASTMRDTRCVLLMMCNGHTLANKLFEVRDTNVDYVIYCEGEILDDACREFSGSFYQLLASGLDFHESFNVALTQARGAIKLMDANSIARGRTEAATGTPVSPDEIKRLALEHCDRLRLLRRLREVPAATPPPPPYAHRAAFDTPTPPGSSAHDDFPDPPPYPWGVPSCTGAGTDYVVEVEGEADLPQDAIDSIINRGRLDAVTPTHRTPGNRSPIVLLNSAHRQSCDITRAHFHRSPLLESCARRVTQVEEFEESDLFNRGERRSFDTARTVLHAVTAAGENLVSAAGGMLKALSREWKWMCCTGCQYASVHLTLVMPMVDYEELRLAQKTGVLAVLLGRETTLDDPTDLGKHEFTLFVPCARTPKADVVRMEGPAAAEAPSTKTDPVGGSGVMNASTGSFSESGRRKLKCANCGKWRLFEAEEDYGVHGSEKFYCPLHPNKKKANGGCEAPADADEVTLEGTPRLTPKRAQALKSFPEGSPKVAGAQTGFTPHDSVH